MKTNKMKCKRYSLKSIVAVMTAMCMIFVSVVPASAATGQWSGLAENEALIKDTITAIASGVTEHEVITNVSTGDDGYMRPRA